MNFIMVVIANELSKDFRPKGGNKDDRLRRLLLDSVEFQEDSASSKTFGRILAEGDEGMAKAAATTGEPDPDMATAGGLTTADGTIIGTVPSNRIEYACDVLPT